MVSTYHAGHRAPVLTSVLLILTLLQGSSFTLTLAFKGPMADETLVTIVSMIWVIMYGLAILGLFTTSGINWISWTVRYRLLLTIIMAGITLSIGWSIDTALSLERAIHIVGSTLIAVYLGLNIPLSRMLKVSVWILGFIMLASVVAALFVPTLGLFEYQGADAWAGVLASKNTLGFWAAITFLLSASMCFWSFRTGQKLILFGIVMLSLLCIYKSLSATSYLSLVSAALVMLYLHASLNLRLNVVAMILLAVLFSGIATFAFSYIDTAELIGRSGDLTGRSEVWSQTWKLILERPLTGYGYGVLWFPTEDSLWIQKSLTDFSWTVYHAHNGLLQIASEIGLPLTIITTLMILQQIVEIIYCQYQRQQPGVLFVLGFVVALLVSNYSEARLLGNRELYWIFFIALPISMLRQVTLVTSQSPNPYVHKISGNGAPSLRTVRERKAAKLLKKASIKRLSALRTVNSTLNNVRANADKSSK